MEHCPHSRPNRPNGAGYPPLGPLTLALNLGWRLISQSVTQGALPQLYAATATDVRGGQYYGPGRLRETRGRPAPAAASPEARDERTARLLWERTAELTGVPPDPA